MTIDKVALEEVWQMRQQVMYPNHTIEDVKLPHDELGVHIGLFLFSQLVSVVSLFYKNGDLQFRKFATKIDYQNKGYGTLLLQYVFKNAVENKCHTVWCNARVTAISFYEKFGMKTVGEKWEQDGYEFVKMKVEIQN